jgi:hypothetical protein
VRTHYFDAFFADATAAGIRQVVILASGLKTIAREKRRSAIRTRLSALRFERSSSAVFLAARSGHSHVYAHMIQ